MRQSQFNSLLGMMAITNASIFIVGSNSLAFWCWFVLAIAYEFASYKESKKEQKALEQYLAYMSKKEKESNEK